MAIHTIKTRRHGVWSFSCIDAGGYVRLEVKDRPYMCGPQLCAGGNLLGVTLTATKATLPRVARSWLRQWQRAIEK